MSTDIWTCKIGMTLHQPLPSGADLPMRKAVEKAYAKLTGGESDFLFSGWGGSLSAIERSTVDNSLATEQMIVSFEIKELAQKGLLNQLVDRVNQNRLLGLPLHS